MRQIAALLLPLLALLPQPLAAEALPYDFDFGEAELTPPPAGGARFAMPGRLDAVQPPSPRRLSYGPFVVLDDRRAALMDVTDEASPDAFAAMMRDHPGIAKLDMVLCPGTENDRANLQLGRMIRARGIATHVPADGWVASGAVELFLAGARRSVDQSARFAVHSWEDESGRGPLDYAADAPKNREYLDYYRAMGMSDGEAEAFYAMTNAAPFESPRYLSSAEMAAWAGTEKPHPASPSPIVTLPAEPRHPQWVTVVYRLD